MTDLDHAIAQFEAAAGELMPLAERPGARKALDHLQNAKAALRRLQAKADEIVDACRAAVPELLAYSNSGTADYGPGVLYSPALRLLDKLGIVQDALPDVKHIPHAEGV